VEWVLCSLLAGLFALNFTFTVFIVALPTVATQFHTSVTVLPGPMVGPLLAYGLAAPILGKTGTSSVIGGSTSLVWPGDGLGDSHRPVAQRRHAAVRRTLDGVQAPRPARRRGTDQHGLQPQDRVKAMGW